MSVDYLMIIYMLITSVSNEYMLYYES